MILKSCFRIRGSRICIGVFPFNSYPDHPPGTPPGICIENIPGPRAFDSPFFPGPGAFDNHRDFKMCTVYTVSNARFFERSEISAFLVSNFYIETSPKANNDNNDNNQFVLSWLQF